MNPTDDELHWLAYRYSAGELSPEDTVEFDALLAVDQRAREALARAVGLSELVCAAESSAQFGRRSTKGPALVPASAARRNWPQEAGWIAAGVAACVAVVMTWQVFRADRVEVARRAGSQVVVTPDIQVVDVGPVDDETRMLLAMLDEEGTQRVTAPVAEVEPEEMGEVEFEVVLDDGTTEESLEDQNATPDWLLAAVAESQS